MGKVINAIGIFRMRRLEADVERADRKVIRADTHPELFNNVEPIRLWGTSIIKAIDLASKQMEFNDIIRDRVDDIILPPNLEEE